MRVLRWRILNVPNPRTSMFFCPCSASLIDSRNASTTRAQSFLEIIGPAVREIWAVTLSTRSALVIRNASFSGARRVGTHTELSDVNSYVSRVWATSSGVRTNRFEELVEQRAGIVRAGSGLRMVLDREDGLGAVPESLHGAVVQVHVRDLEVRSPRNALLLTR